MGFGGMDFEGSRTPVEVRFGSIVLKKSGSPREAVVGLGGCQL